jgi:hypothetical protein
MARGLQHDRLMRVSHSHVAATARDDSQENQILALRLIQHPGTYSDWENQHSQLMKQVCQPPRLRQQIIQMRATTLSLVHRRAVFEFLRDSKITGVKRRRFIAMFYGSRDYASSVVIEHGHYVRSWVSASCARFIGAEILYDPAFEAPLAAYEQWYGEYFRMFCHVQVASAAEEEGTVVQRALVPVLKERAREAREQLLHLPYAGPH